MLKVLSVLSTRTYTGSDSSVVPVYITILKRCFPAVSGIVKVASPFPFEIDVFKTADAILPVGVQTAIPALDGAL